LRFSQKTFVKSQLKGKKLGIMAYDCHLNNRGKCGAGLWSSWPEQKSRPYLQSNHSKKGWSVAQAIELLPQKLKVLNSNPSTTKERYRAREEREHAG
jgi:hypothetical protein